MSKIGSNKKACEKYRNSGHKEENKAAKQKRHEKRMERFTKRKEEGKSYTYRAGHAQEKLKENRSRKDYNPVLGVWETNVGSGRAVHTEFNKWRSIMAKLDYQLNKQKAADKAAKKAVKKDK